MMTHRKSRPRPGFTFDFDTSATSASAPIIIDDDPQPSSSSSSSIAAPSTSSSSSSALICARCDQALVMGSRTMWGLRCGHVVCGGCADYLSRPIEGKGKGKEVAHDEKGQVVVKEEVKEEEQEVEVRPIKGHGRGGRRAAPSTPTNRRLRNTTSEATAKSRDTAPSRKRRRSPTKRRDSVVVEEHEFNCPVSGCHKPHWSIRTWKDGPDDGEYVWKPKPEVGAIPIFT